MENFVTYDLAVKLKEKGFNKECFAHYDDLGNLLLDKDYWKLDSHILAPTISQVLEWLREKKEISIEIGIHCSLKWMCSIYEFSDGIKDVTQYDIDGINDTIYILYTSYEQAALAGIEYVLDNLI